MKKLKIRQYWTSSGRNPFYVIRYGINRGDYFISHTEQLNFYINGALRIAHK